MCFIDGEYIGDEKDFSRWLCKRFDFNICEDWVARGKCEFNNFLDRSRVRYFLTILLLFTYFL